MARCSKSRKRETRGRNRRRWSRSWWTDSCAARVWNRAWRTRWKPRCGICGAEARAAVQEPDADAWRDISFQTSYRNPRTGFVVGELSPKHFSFNSHIGACEACEGLGTEMFCDPGLLIDYPAAPLLKGGLRGWWPEKSSRAGQFQRETKALLGCSSCRKTPRRDLPGTRARLVVSRRHARHRLEGRPREKTPQTKPFEGLTLEALRRFHEAKATSPAAGFRA
jgi:excinuclease ABC subunit A